MRTSVLLTLIIAVVAPACVPRPVELGFWIEPQSYQSQRLGDPLTTAEYATIGTVARAEIARAFDEFAVALSANHDARYHVAVVGHLKDWRMPRREMTYAGESRAMAGFGGSGAVNFEYVANGATVFASPEATRAQVIDTIGRGIGRVAIHEFLHQLLPHAPIDGSKDIRSYEGNTAATAEGYSGELHWDLAHPLLQARLAPRTH